MLGLGSLFQSTAIHLYSGFIIQSFLILCHVQNLRNMLYFYPSGQKKCYPNRSKNRALWDTTGDLKLINDLFLNV